MAKFLLSRLPLRDQQILDPTSAARRTASRRTVSRRDSATRQALPRVSTGNRLGIAPRAVTRLLGRSLVHGDRRLWPIVGPARSRFANSRPKEKRTRRASPVIAGSAPGADHRRLA